MWALVSGVIPVSVNVMGSVVTQLLSLSTCKAAIQ